MVAAVVTLPSFGGERVPFLHLHLSGSSMTIKVVALVIYTRAVSSTLVSVDSNSNERQLKPAHTLSTPNVKLVS